MCHAEIRHKEIYSLLGIVNEYDKLKIPAWNLRLTKINYIGGIKYKMKQIEERNCIVLALLLCRVVGYCF